MNKGLRIVLVGKREEWAAAPVNQVLKRFPSCRMAWLGMDEVMRFVFTPDDVAVVKLDADDLAPLQAFGTVPLLVLLCGSPDDGDALERVEQLIHWPPGAEEFYIKLDKLCQLVAWRRHLQRQASLVGNLVGCSPALQRVRRDIERFARCDAPLLITGETGTGKELVARAVHYLCADDSPFVAVNCGAIPDDLFENELFGHVRGAYTDARESQRGLVELAEGGTLFLDEIEALSGKGQVALLRFLQDYEYRPLGSQQVRRARLRVMSATNEPLEQLVEQGRFRRDLLYRIKILAIDLPPLRQRGEDVVYLAEHFLAQYRRRYHQYDKYLAPETLAWMQRYHWPGNVRELENMILREFLLAEESRIAFAPEHPVPEERRRNRFDRRYHHLYQRSFREAKARVVGEFEKNYLRHMLEQAGGNVAEAARRAGKERRSFTKLMEKHGLARRDFRRLY